MTSPQYGLYLYERNRHLMHEQWYWTYKVWCWMRGLVYDHADKQQFGGV